MPISSVVSSSWRLPISTLLSSAIPKALSPTTAGAGSSANPESTRFIQVGRRETAEGCEGVTGAIIRGLIRVGGRSPGGLQALLGAPMAVYDGPGGQDEDRGHGRNRSRTRVARVCGDIGCAVGSSVADGAVRSGVEMARSRQGATELGFPGPAPGEDAG